MESVDFGSIVRQPTSTPCIHWPFRGTEKRPVKYLYKLKQVIYHYPLASKAYSKVNQCTIRVLDWIICGVQLLPIFELQIVVLKWWSLNDLRCFFFLNSHLRPFVGTKDWLSTQICCFVSNVFTHKPHAEHLVIRCNSRANCMTSLNIRSVHIKRKKKHKSFIVICTQTLLQIHTIWNCYTTFLNILSLSPSRSTPLLRFYFFVRSYIVCYDTIY